MADAVGKPGGDYEATTASMGDSAAVLGAMIVVKAMAMVEAMGLVGVKPKRSGSSSPDCFT